MFLLSVGTRLPDFTVPLLRRPPLKPQLSGLNCSKKNVMVAVRAPKYVRIVSMRYVVATCLTWLRLCMHRNVLSFINLYPVFILVSWGGVSPLGS
jgi:hypothetical protein